MKRSLRFRLEDKREHRRRKGEEKEKMTVGSSATSKSTGTFSLSFFLLSFFQDPRDDREYISIVKVEEKDTKTNQKVRDSMLWKTKEREREWA